MGPGPGPGRRASHTEWAGKTLPDGTGTPPLPRMRRQSLTLRAQAPPPPLCAARGCAGADASRFRPAAVADRPAGRAGPRRPGLARTRGPAQRLRMRSCLSWPLPPPPHSGSRGGDVRSGGHYTVCCEVSGRQSCSSGEPGAGLSLSPFPFPGPPPRSSASLALRAASAPAACLILPPLGARIAGGLRGWCGSSR